MSGIRSIHEHLNAQFFGTYCVYIHLSVCPQEMDMWYGIAWDSTVPGGMSFQSFGAGYTGKCIAIEVCV